MQMPLRNGPSSIDIFIIHCSWTIRQVHLWSLPIGTMPASMSAEANTLDYTGRTVLLTGASGFIGSHLAEELVTCGASVRAFLHYNSRGEEGNLRYLTSEIRREIEVVYGDLLDPDAVKKAVRGRTHVFHLGALIAIPYSYVHPFSFVQTNVVGTANILNACLEVGIE